MDLTFQVNNKDCSVGFFKSLRVIHKTGISSTKKWSFKWEIQHENARELTELHKTQRSR